MVLAVLLIGVLAGLAGHFRLDIGGVAGLPESWQKTFPGRAAPGPADMTADQLVIPDLDVLAPVDRVTVAAGELAVPHDASRVGWDIASVPLHDSVGVTLIAGHVTNGPQDGALHDLDQLTTGAKIHVSSSSGDVTAWTVTHVVVTAAADLDPRIFATTGDRRLAIVTCTGPTTYSSGVRHYRDRLLIWAIPTKTREGNE